MSPSLTLKRLSFCIGMKACVRGIQVISGNGTAGQRDNPRDCIRSWPALAGSIKAGCFL